MPENMQPQNNPQDRLKEIVEGIEQGIRDLFASDKFAEYLRTMSRFHTYSVNNTVLIHMQNPNATLVAGFNRWRDQFERHVKKGEKAIRIIAPVPYKKSVTQEKLDPDTKAPVIGPDGQVVTEKVEITVPRFRAVPVFDVSQTYGKPIPTLASDLTGNVEQFDILMEAIRRSSPVPIKIVPLPKSLDGYFKPSEHLTRIREGMSEIQTVSATIHETAHAMLHDPNAPAEAIDETVYQPIMFNEKLALFTNERVNRKDLPEGLYAYDLRGADDDPGKPAVLESSVSVNHAGTVITSEPLELPERGYIELEDGLDFIGDMEISLREFLQSAHPEQKIMKNRNTREVEAESIAYAVCQYYGIDTGENSFGYIATWSRNKELPELRASLETITKTANTLINSIDRHIAEIKRERGLDKAQEAIAPEKSDMPTPAQQSAPENASPAEQRAPEPTPPAPETPPPPPPVQDTSFAIPPGTYPLPDSSVAPNEYFDQPDLSDMLPLGAERARELLDQDMSIYMIQSDGMPALVIDHEDIDTHQGLFGIQKDEWEQSTSYKEFAAARGQQEKELESAFINYPTDAYAIYQLRETSATRDYRFESLDTIRAAGLSINPQLYEPLYTASLPHVDGQDTYSTLDNLFGRFNYDRPTDFQGHSMSTSDIIALKQDGRVSYHYVDRWQFVDVTKEFTGENPLKSAEMSLEDDYGMIDGIINNGQKQPTVAELEQQASSGKPISLMDLAAAVHRENRKERKSVLAQLEQQPKQPHKKTAPKKSAEKER